MKKTIVLLMGLCAFTFTGCAVDDSVRSYLEEIAQEEIFEQSGISEDSDYADYQSLKNEGKLDETGKYNGEPPADEEEIAKAPIHVTFADNRYIKALYFSDEDHTQSLGSGECYLNPGDTIYFSNVECDSPNTDLYIFDGFRVVEYIGEQRGGIIAEIPAKDEGVLYEIPVENAPSELSIEPLGKYDDRDLLLRVYWRDDKGKHHAINDGSWYVNDKEYAPSEAVIDPNISYKVSYKFDGNKYYYVNANPGVFRQSDLEGIIEFNQSDPKNGISKYEIELHPYVNVVIADKNKKLEEVSVDGRTVEGVGTKEVSIPKLMANAKVIVETESDYKIASTDIVISDPVKTDNGYKFTLDVPTNGPTEIDLSVLKWQSKTIKPDMELNAFYERILYAAPWKEKSDISLFTIATGDKTYTYEDLKNGAKVKFDERDTLIVKFDKSQLKDVTVKMTVNGLTSYVINADSKEFNYEFKYADVSSLKFEISN